MTRGQRARAFAKPAFAAALLVLLGAELRLGGPAASPDAAPLRIAAVTPDDAADAISAQWTQTVLARPLFSPHRRPDAARATNTVNALPRLSAIIVIDGRSCAIFAADGQKPLILREGETLDGYLIKKIAPDSVDLAGPPGRVTLHPQFSNATPVAVVNNTY